MRGTQPGYADLAADLGDILADGIALDQTVEMYNYWQSLTHSGVYQAVKLETSPTETTTLNLLKAAAITPAGQLAYNAYLALLQQSGAILDNGIPLLVRRIVPVDSNLLSDPRLQTGSGTLTTTASVNVDGHSLGGHLAMAFSRLFPGATNSVTAVNGAGFNFANSNVNNLFSALNGAPGFDTGKITNVVGSAAINLISQDWLFLQQPAGRQEIYTESYSPFSTTLGHGSGQMTDSLALYNLFATLAPNATVDAITDILKAASNVADRSLENTLDALRTLFLRNYPDGSANLTAPATATDDREAYYANLNALQTALVNGPFTTFNLTSLSGQSASALQSAAQSDIATRYALYRLNPFVVSGASALYDQINTNGALTLYDTASGSGVLTTQYLTDRAAMLDALIQRNTQYRKVPESNCFWLPELRGEQCRAVRV